MGITEDAHSYCAGLVETQDRDRFLTVLFAPPAHRAALLALYAFNHEVAKTRAVASQPAIGAIRLQWWRDSLDGIAAGTPRRHQVILALADSWDAYDPAALERLVDARESDLEEGPRTLDEFVAYASGTGGGLCREACRLLGGDEAALVVADHVGTAWAMTGILRALAASIAAARLPLPDDVLAQHGISRRDVLDFGRTDGLAPAVAEIAATARDLLDHANQDHAPVLADARSPLLLAALARGHLKRLARNGFDALRPEIATPLSFATWRLALASRFGRRV